MGRMMGVYIENGTLTTAVRNFIHISAAAAGSTGSNIKIKRVEISQSGTTTLQMIRGAFSRQTAGTTVTAAATPIAESLRPMGGAATALTASTTPAGAASRYGMLATVNTTPTYVDDHVFAFANTNGYIWQPTPEQEIWIAPSQIWTVRFAADPTTLTGWDFSIVWEEE